MSVHRPPRLDYPTERVANLREAFGEICAQAVFTVWKWKWGSGRWSKFPLHSAWTHGITFDQALRRFDSSLAGLGVKFGPLGDGRGLWGIDYDAKEPLPEGWPSAPTYYERSPSGGGRWHMLALHDGAPLAGQRAGGIEIYMDGRFFTLTGERIHGSRIRVVDPFPFYAALGVTTARDQRGAPTWEGLRGPVTDLSEDELDALRALLRSGSAAKFRRLWSGDTRDFESASEADLAMASLLAIFAGRRPDRGRRIERLMRASGLYRDKWERPAYLRHTVAKALDDE